MDALGRPGHGEGRGCECCRHAVAVPRDGLYCGRGGRLPYPCEVERAAAPLAAWLYGACGRHGRFFEARAPLAARAPHPLQHPRAAASSRHAGVA